MAEDWAIEHVEEDTYDIICLLEYDARDVTMWGPNATYTRISWGSEEEWRKTHEIIEAGAHVRERLIPKLVGQPSAFRLEISWTDPSGLEHFRVVHHPAPRPYA